MKIDVVGCMCTWTKLLSTSYIINDEILFDAPQGTFKTLFADYDLTKINYIILSHFHSDHFTDIHLVMDYIYHHCKGKKIIIIAPKGCKERLISLFKIVEVSYLEEALKDMYEIVECENNKIIKLGQYKIKCYKMLHGSVESFGFKIEQNGLIAGFSGDTAMCNNVRKIISKSKIAFVDASNIEKNNKHLCVEEIVSLKEEFTNCKIYPVHMSIYSVEKLKELGIHTPSQGDIVELN